MLQEMNRLALEADGEYATDDQLNFIDEYVQSLSLRIETYNKIREQEKEVVQQMQTGLYEKDADIFAHNTASRAEVFCRRDTMLVLRHSACAMLTDDYDRLRESLLLWQRTIMLAFKMEECTRIMFSELMPLILTNLLAQEEYALMKPALQLDENVLAY